MLGEKLITLRKKYGLTQSELAKKLYVSRQAVSKWEHNFSTPNIDTLNKLSQIYDISVDSILNDNIEIKNAHTPIPEQHKTINKYHIMLCIGSFILILIIILSFFVPAQIKVINEITSDDLIMLTPTTGSIPMVPNGETVEIFSYEEITGNVFCFINTYYLHGVVFLAFLFVVFGLYGIFKKTGERID